MDKLNRWYQRYYVEITWFLIGWLSICGLQDLGHGNYIEALFSFVLVAINYHMYRK